MSFVQTRYQGCIFLKGETNEDEFRSDDETSEDDEETICEQEDHEGSGSNDDEIKDLEDEGW